MSLLYNILGYALVVACALFLADGVVGLVRAARGSDDDAVQRRVDGSMRLSAGSVSDLTVLRDQKGRFWWSRVIPFRYWLLKLIMQSGVKTGLLKLLVVISVIAFGTTVGLLFVLPIELAWAAMVLGLLIGVGPVLVFLMRRRARRQRTFDEQLPDAIDLIIRSLKIGHPMIGAMQVIARDMPEPIAGEFAIACEQVTYGREIPTTFFDMTDRVGASDLGYLAVAVQIQQESGGNLVESLSKLSAVIRDRFRMFRKVKAITAEGRFSAWVLSLFPFAIAGMITLVKPNYYVQVMNFRYFPHLVVLVVIMLGINIVAMRILTTLKV